MSIKGEGNFNTSHLNIVLLSDLNEYLMFQKKETSLTTLKEVFFFHIKVNSSSEIIFQA